MLSPLAFLSHSFLYLYPADLDSHPLRPVSAVTSVEICSSPILRQSLNPLTLIMICMSFPLLVAYSASCFLILLQSSRQGLSLYPPQHLAKGLTHHVPS